ncbi:MAG: RMD1 family protein [Sphingobacteriales bacterium]|jgi:uncharacterized Rmd1/YagE family protein|nr:RMD1 family protein [Sphingobacteriales bacterium]MBP9141951.1 RMD1 family protein [Chitinophagales bacterium]MDA0199124.1 RMD1 family protein [Bacteroidota bacterium]MBK6888529.1 RMD1 family protein [Sphingobacteriales bacterium]MBK7528963.1 RMD1 family protein [Sphingobacteriales bacterium]
MLPIIALNIAYEIDLKRFKDNFTGLLIAESSSELFYRIIDGNDGQYIYLSQYGVVAFANLSDVDMSKFLQLLTPYCKNLHPEKMRDDFIIHVNPADPNFKFTFNDLTLPTLNENVVHIVLFNLAQSVALDRYVEICENLLAEVQQFSTQLEVKGKLNINRTNMLKFIGRTLNTKNRIVENLYIFDSPDIAWDDEYLDKINRGMVKTFDLQTRFRSIEYTLRMVEDNLLVFKELYLHRESTQLEWVIIILIFIELLDLIFSKLMHYF